MTHTPLVRDNGEPELVGRVWQFHALVVELCEHLSDLTDVWQVLIHVDQVIEVELGVRIRLLGSLAYRSWNAVTDHSIQLRCSMEFALEQASADISG